MCHATGTLLKEPQRVTSSEHRLGARSRAQSGGDMTDPVVDIQGDKIEIGPFVVIDRDIAEHLGSESPEGQSRAIRDAVVIGMKVILNERVSLATDTILDRVERQINDLLGNPDLQEEGTPFGAIISEITQLREEIREQKFKKRYSSSEKGSEYEDFVAGLLKAEFGNSVNVVQTGAQRATKVLPGKKGDLTIQLNPETPFELKIAVEAKNRDVKNFNIEMLKRETSTTLEQRDVPVVLWVLPRPLGEKFMQDGAIQWSVDLGYVMVIADEEKPDMAQPMLGAAVRVAQLVYHWRTKMQGEFNLKFAEEFVSRMKTRLNSINQITTKLNAIGTSQIEAYSLSQTLYTELNRDLQEFAKTLNLDGPTQEAQQ